MDKTILTVLSSEDGKQYKVQIPEGMTLSEVMFGVAVMIKCMVRDGVIEKSEVATEMLIKYLNDSQYDEVKA